MGILPFVLVFINGAIFGYLVVESTVNWRREESPRVKRLWLTVSLVSGALLVGAVQRMLLQGATVGWLSSRVPEDFLTEWQVIQSVIVGVLAVSAFVNIRKVADSMLTSEAIVGTMMSRASGVDLSSLKLSAREKEVLALIGSGVVSDKALADQLGIAVSTVQTHVKSLLKKTGLGKRYDLIALAYLSGSGSKT